MNRIPRFFILFGALCLLGSGILFWQRANTSRLSFNVHFKTAQHIKKTTVVPKRIVIQSISVDLPIVPSKIIKKEMETTMKGVSYLDLSPVPGQMGNSILYGHNFDALLGRLPRIKPGDTIVITYSDKSQKSFTVNYTQVVTPKQVNIIEPTADKRLTIYTCTGFFDSQRFVAVAFPKG